MAALDHWVTREIVDRAVAQDPSASWPPKFNKLTIPIELFEKIHYQSGGDGPIIADVVRTKQDLNAAHWRMLRAIVPPGRNDLFLVGDTHQRIYDNWRS